MSPSLPAEYFNNLYADSDDPWQISTGWYEQRKRALVMASLPREHYRLGFEPGCSNGDLTVLLADRCDRFVAWDVAEAAVARARQRSANQPSVEIRRGALPDDWPAEQADLIVLSETGYYLDATDLECAIDRAADLLVPGGTLVAVHWRHPATDYPLRGDQVHEHIGAHDALAHLGGYHDADFLLDIWTHGSAPSVAQQIGVI
ncbi:MAG: SAM-dependent methyltransferase [Jatrophihabitantaceae bacterium]